MESTSHFEDVSKQKWTLLCNSKGLYIDFGGQALHTSLQTSHISQRAWRYLHCIRDGQVSLGKTCQNWNKFQAWKSLVASYHTHSLPVSDSRCWSRAVNSWEGPWLDDQEQEVTELSLVLSLSFREYLGPDPFLGDSSVNILSKHISGSAQPLLAALGSWVTLKRQPKFWDGVHVTEVCSRDLLDEVHPHDRTAFPFKEHHHTPKPLNTPWLPNTPRHTLKP